MKKHYPSKLDPFADQLDHWFDVENMTLAQAADRLRELGCDVTVANLSHWCRVRRQQQCQEQLLHDISSGAQQCEQVEKEFAENAAPDVETLLKLHRVLILQLSTQAGSHLTNARSSPADLWAGHGVARRFGFPSPASQVPKSDMR